MAPVKLDAAITVTDFGHGVQAHIKLKPGRWDSLLIIRTHLSASNRRLCLILGLVKLGVADKLLTIPFVLNRGETAVVCTTIPEKDEKGEISL